MTRHRSIISQTRGSLYKAARFLGDLKAVQQGPAAVERRILRRAAGKFTSRILGSLFRK